MGGTLGCGIERQLESNRWGTLRQMPDVDEEAGKHRQPVSVAPSQGMFASLALPRFRTLWTGMLFSSAAMQFNLISRPWLAFQLTGSGLDLGIVAAARALPQLVLAPLGGVVAD